MGQMKALVTGGAGFIGANLALSLQHAGWEVKIIDDFSSGHRSNLAGFTQQVIHGEVQNTDLSLGGWNPSVIFHQAGITDTTFRDSNRMRKTNVQAFRAVLQYALQIVARVVYASSAAVYGNSSLPMSEAQTPNPLNAYAESKVEMEDLAESYRKSYELSVIGLRYFNVYGSGENHKNKTSSMAFQLTNQMRAGSRPRIFKWGEQTRDQIYIKDVVRANLIAANSAVNGVYNVGTGNAVSFNDMIAQLKEILQIDVGPEYFDNPHDFYQHHTQADTRLSEKDLGFRAMYTFQQGLFEYLNCLNRSVVTA